MKVLAITSLLVALAAVASATPIEERQVDIDVPLEQQADVVARAQPGAAADQTSKALVCTDKYFRRDCKILRRPAGECGVPPLPFTR